MKAGLILRWGGIVGLCMVMALGGLEAGRAQDRTGELAAPLDTGFTYQGELTDGDGSPIATACDFQFGLWDSASGGAQLGGISAASGIQVSEGPFSAPVNAAGEFGSGAFDGGARWLEVGVRCPTGGGEYSMLTPRQPLTAVPYASYAAAAGSAPWSGLTGVPIGFSDGVDDDTTYSNGAGLSLSGGQFSVNFGGTGAATTVARSDHLHDGSYAPILHNHWGADWGGSGTGLTLSGGTIGLSGSGTQYGLYGQTPAASGRGLYGYASSGSGTTYGVEGTSVSPDGVGVWGRAIASTGETNGVYGYTSSTSGRGVFGVAGAATGTTYGVYGRTDSASAGATGVVGEATNASGDTYGVQGWAGADGGIGVYGGGGWRGVHGRSDAVYGAGVYGESQGWIGVTYGVVGVAWSPDARGVYGRSDSSGGIGGLFESAGGGLALVAGSATSGDIFQVENADEVVFRVNGDGNVHADGGYHCGNDIWDGAGDLDENEIAPCLYDSSPADFAEMLPAAAGLEPGDVLAVDLGGQLVRSTERYQRSVFGVYSTRPSYLGNGEQWGQANYAPLAITGVVPVKVSAENGSIRPGDLLVASSIPGHAMRAGNDPPVGTVIGKALGDQMEETGVIQVLVVLQ